MDDALFEGELLEVAERAARAAGAELMARIGRAELGVRVKSSPTDPVSEADLAAERAIREILARERPQDAILGEEGGETSATGRDGGAAGDDGGGGAVLRWVVDPLDGTVNYLYGYPAFGVSIAVEDHSGAIAGIVLDPCRQECFSATRSGPALLNGVPIVAARADELASALVATGFGYDSRLRRAQAETAARLLPRARDIRRGGSAALDLCYCACGRLDAYFERGVRVWDYEAGALICMRAGLSVRRLPAATFSDSEGEVRLPDGIIVAPPPLIDELEQVVAGSTISPPVD